MDIDDDATLALVIRGGNVLARPEGHNGGPIPTLEEGREHVTVVNSFEYDGMTVVT